MNEGNLKETISYDAQRKCKRITDFIRSKPEEKQILTDMQINIKKDIDKGFKNEKD